MFKDKLRAMIKKDDNENNEGNNKKKIENLVFFIIVLIITIVIINYIWNGNNKEEKEITPQAENYNDVKKVSSEVKEDDIETKLANILSNINGVGNVKVLLTYSETSTYVPIYNENTKDSNTTETDSSGGSRTISEKDSQKEVIFKEDGSGNKEPITKNIISPKIEGAIITAQGADDANVKASIIQAVEAATGLATHKIQVFKMGE